MRATIDIEIPDYMQERARFKGQSEGLSVQAIAERLYKAWVVDIIQLPPPPSEPEQYTESKEMSADEWIAGLKAFADEINRNRTDSRPLCEILDEGRNRLEPNSPSLYPGRTNQKITKDGYG